MIVFLTILSILLVTNILLLVFSANKIQKNVQDQKTYIVGSSSEKYEEADIEIPALKRAV